MRKRDGLGIALVFGKFVDLYQELTSMTLKSDTPGSRTVLRINFVSYSDFYAISFLSSLTCLPIPKKTLLLP
jgi:hypothetical protein